MMLRWCSNMCLEHSFLQACIASRPVSSLIATASLVSVRIPAYTSRSCQKLSHGRVGCW